jgi:hypothetical protein
MLAAARQPGCFKHVTVRLNSLRGNSGPGNDRQGLKPSLFPIVYGPTKVVP